MNTTNGYPNQADSATGGAEQGSTVSIGSRFVNPPEPLTGDALIANALERKLTGVLTAYDIQVLHWVSTNLHFTSSPRNLPDSPHVLYCGQRIWPPLNLEEIEQ